MTLLTYFDDETEEQREEKVKKRHRHEIMFFLFKFWNELRRPSDQN